MSSKTRFFFLSHFAKIECFMVVNQVILFKNGNILYIFKRVQLYAMILRTQSIVFFSCESDYISFDCMKFLLEFM